MQELKAMEATLSERVFTELRDLIRQHTGICFGDNKRYLLESRLRLRLVACEVTSYEAYLRYVKRGDDPNEIMQLINAVTINETSFFRHPAQFEALEQELLPALVRRRQDEGAHTVRLWSAACSAGDEPYSLAIVLKERVQPRFPRMRFEIVATDIDTEMLAAARTGRYRARAVRNIPTAYLHKYFRRSGEAYVLKPSVKDMVTFRHLNLVDAQAARRMRDFDLIMCANVLIYFDAPTKQGVLQSLRRALRPGGYLFVGGSEALGEEKAGLQSVQSAGALAYQRPLDVPASAAPRNVRASSRSWTAPPS